MTIANKITTFRLAVSLAYLVCLSLYVRAGDHDPLLLDAFCLTALAIALLDVADGIAARYFNEATKSGRIIDPLTDKIAICGTFILFLGLGSLSDIITPWMVVVIVIREFYTSTIRAFAEERGIEFPASVWGKFKTLTEVIVIIGCYLYISHVHNFDGGGFWLLILNSLVVVMLFSLVISAIMYTYQLVKETDKGLDTGA